MPEGDTIYRAAATLQRALAGQTISRFETVLPQLARVNEDAPLAGRTVERVEAAGKNLLIHFSGDLHLLTHMRMNGSWHIYRSGERWRKRSSEMRIVLETDVWTAVAFNVPVAEFHDTASLGRQKDLRRIGPDLLAAEFDGAEALRRIREHEASEIADVLLNQHVIAGIGNEYKSEVLFISRVSPFARVRDLRDDELAAILANARKVMVANVRNATAARVTTGSLDPRRKQFVYGRGGEPCRRCGTPVGYAKQGRDARGTYWCPQCQATPST